MKKMGLLDTVYSHQELYKLLNATWKYVLNTLLELHTYLSAHAQYACSLLGSL